MIGEFRIQGSDLSESITLRRGDEVILLWSMDAGQNITISVEIPKTEQVFSGAHFYNWQSGLLSFDGEEGDKLVRDAMNTAQSDLDEAEDTLPADYAAKVRRWCIELEEYRDRLRNSVEPDTRKQIADQTRLIGQQIASAEARPDARVAVLMRRLNSDLGFYDRQVRADSDPEANQRFDLLVSKARTALGNETKGSLDLVECWLSDMNNLFWEEGYKQLRLRKVYWNIACEERHRARDRDLFDQTKALGDQAAVADDLEGLRAALFAQWRNMLTQPAKRDVTARASLMNR
jgi:hypothetical protein